MQLSSMMLLLLAGLSSAAVPYSIASDPNLLAMYEPATGLVDQAVFGAWGNLSLVGGSAVPIAGSLDGNPYFQLTKKAGTSGYLTTTTGNRFWQPVHLFIVGRWLASTTINTGMICSPVGGVANLVYWDTTTIGLTGNGIAGVTSPLNWHVYEVYYHVNFTYVSIDGGPFTKHNSGTGSDWGGVLLGAGGGGGNNPANCDVAHVLVVEGQATEQLRTAEYARLRTMFPSVLASATPPTIFSLATATPNPLWNPAQPWDAVIVLGQSNASNFASDNSSAAWNAGTFLLGNDYLWKAGGDPAVAFQWDNPTNQTDTISLDPVGTRGSLAGALANTLRASTGRPTVLVPCATSASSVVAGASPLNPQSTWVRTWPRGHNFRNSKYWSAVARALEVIRWGGTIKAVVLYQGETEAQNADASIRNAWPAAAQSLIDNFWADIGLPNPRLNVGDRARTTVIVRIAGNALPIWTDFRTNVIPTITQNANQILVDAPVAGPFEGDGIHLRSAALDTLGVLIANAILS